jgi:hypothetical protein
LENKTVSLKISGQLAISKTDFRDLKALGDLLKTYGEKLTIHWNGKDVCPTTNGIMLTHGEWTGWGKLPLGINASAGAKGGEMFVVPVNEIELFEGDGQDGGALTRGAPIVDINTHEELWSVGAQIMILGAMYPGEKPLVKFSTDLGLDQGEDMVTMEMLTVGQALQGKFEFYEEQVAQTWANDSVPVSCASVLHAMDRENILAAAPFGGGKSARIKNLVQNSLDSVPSHQSVRIPRADSDNVNWTKATPDELNLVNDEYNVGSIPQQFYDLWNHDVRLTSAKKDGTSPGVVGVKSQFLDHLSEPVAPAKAGVAFRFLADQDLQVAKYIYNPTSPPPVGS